MKNKGNSLMLWEKYGEYVLLATGYKDNILKEAEGCYIRDVDGNEFLDLESGQMCAILGHNNQVLMKRLIEQMQKIGHSGTTFLSEPILFASKKVARIAPGNLKKSIILSTGAEANECAFRIAKEYTGKRGIAGFHQGYSGLTLATSSVGGNNRETSLAVPGSFKILTPNCQRCRVQAKYPGCNFLCLKVSEELLSNHCMDMVAGIIAEPILSSGGMIFPPSGYFAALKEMAKRIGALLICDEAQTGLGRTGKWFGIEHDDVVPDILVLSKGVGGGFPASAVVVSDEIAKGVLGRFSNFSSHQSDPAAGAAISAVIETIEDTGLIQRVSELGSYFLKELTQLVNRYPALENVRGKGLMIGVDARELPEKNLSSEQVGRIFEYLCRQHGVHLKAIHNGKIFRILPPLTIQSKEIDKTITVFENVLKIIIRGDFEIKEVDPQNPFVRKLMEITEHRSTFKRLFVAGWQKSPSELVGKMKKRMKLNRKPE